ncbi:5-oxoprolinase subunit PxpB [Flavitalea flava]
MSDLSPSVSIFPLGDAAITLDLGNHIEEPLNRKVLAIQAWLVGRQIKGVKDIVVAYSSVSIFYDPVLVRSVKAGFQGTAFFIFKQILEEAYSKTDVQSVDYHELDEMKVEGSLIHIPVSYGGEFGPDLNGVALQKGISEEEIIRLHTDRIYRVYMIGFLPGFSYLGKLDERLTVSRKKNPVPVRAGGVGIAGSQTGVYPLDSPGGWQIIGRTPIRLFDPKAKIPVWLKAGDHVRFFAISTDDYLAFNPKNQATM